MDKLFEKNLSIVLLAIISYFLFCISKSLNKTAKYNSDLRSCKIMKVYSNNKESSKLFEQKKAISTEISIKLVS